jgi:D-galactarolactone cycloisomerase
MTRRVFLSVLAASAALRAAPRPRCRITGITLVTIQGRFHKFVAMNSYDEAPKGHTYTNTLIRIVTDLGVEGVGVMGYAGPDPDYLKGLQQLIGVDPMDVYTLQDGRIVGRSPAFEDLLTRHMHLDGPLFDLIGKLSEKPAWKLLGDAARDRIEAYDGTLYFSDIWFKDRGVRAVLEEAEEAVKSGYTGLKFKVGRGWKWMPHQAGLQRDIEVLRAAREAVGTQVKVLADANNGYRDDFDGAWRLMSETKDVNLYWMEEIFPESVPLDIQLRRRMAEAGIRTLIADGENLREPGALAPYLKSPRVFDVVQMDIRVGGFLANRELARMAGAAGAVAVPHNWASQVGKFMGLHLAKAVSQVAAAEDDRSTCDVLVATGYEFKNGVYSVSDAPGLGIRIDPAVYRDKYQRGETAIA